jgi:photosystem II stability/assembly factor-like uncharacterized protein
MNIKTLLTGAVILLIAAIFVFADFGSNSNSLPNKVRSSGSPKAKIESKKMRSDYFFNKLRDPKLNAIPANIREIEIAYSKTLPTSNKLFKGNNTLKFDWKEAGPVDLGGRTRALAIDVKNSNTILAGGVSGGIWKSTDKGITWNLKTSPNEVQSVVAIAQDTREGFSNTWYYSAGEMDGSAGDRSGGARFFGGGVYKSTDNGETWQILLSTKVQSSVEWSDVYSFTSEIIVNPKTGSVFIATNGGIIVKSVDQGNTFSPSLGTLNEHLRTDIKVNKDGVLLASLSQKTGSQSQTNNPGFYYSTDDGATWKFITSTNYPPEHDRTVLAFSASKPNIAYALMNTGNKFQDTKADDLRMLRVDLNTEQIEDLSDNIQVYSTEENGILNSQGNYNMALGVHPANENIVFFGLTNVYRTLDGFATKIEDKKVNWIGGYTVQNDNSSHPALHPDIHAFVFDPKNPDDLWVAHDGGLSFTSQASTANYQDLFPWENRDRTYNVTQYYTMSIFDAPNDSRLLGGTQDNGTPYFRFDGSNASPHQDVSTGDGSYSYLGVKYAYASTQNGSVTRLGYDENGNPDPTKWTSITPADAANQLFINPFVVDPNDEDYMYYLGGNMLWRNSELSNLPEFNQDKLTQGWASVDLSLPQNYVYSTLSISKKPAHILYLGAYSDAGNPIVLKLENSKTSSSATDISPNLPEVTSGSYVSAIAVNPDNADEIIICLSNYGIIGLFYSNNGGASWSAIEGNLQGGVNNQGPSIRSATILPYNNSKLYLVATSTGVYSTEILDGMNTVWSLEAPSLIGNVVVETIAGRSSDGVVVVATHGRGAFMGKITGAVSVNDNANIPTSYSLSQNYPNPFNPSTSIRYSIPKESNVKLVVYDAAGREVSLLVNGKQNAGNYSVQFNAQGLASGVYYYRVSAGNYSNSKKMILLK